MSKIDWKNSMEQTFEYYEVDPNTWKDKRLLRTVKSSSITKDLSVETLGSATINIDNLLGEAYIRIYLVAIQNNNTYKVPLGTYLVQTPSSTYDGIIKTVSMDAYTPLLELKENMPPLGYSLNKGVNILEEAYKIIRNHCRAPVIRTTSDKVLKDHFVADPEEKWLSFILSLLYQANYTLDLDENGQILFSPIQQISELQPIWEYNDDNSSILYPEITMQHDLYGVPNVVEVVAFTGTKEYMARVKNDSINSPTSTVNRGREIVHRETNPNLPGFPTESQIEEYARSLLKQLSSVDYQITYAHGYCPVRVGDAIRLNYGRADLQGIKAKVIKQTIKCTSGCQVNETAVFTKNLWI